MTTGASVIGSSAGSAYRRVAAVAPAPVATRARAWSSAQPGVRSSVRPMDLRTQAVTPAAALLAELVHRMGGAAASLARGAYVDVMV